MLTIRSYAAPISEPRLRGSAGTFTRNSVRPRRVVAASTAFFGMIVEFESGLLIVLSDGAQIMVPGEPVNWKTFPRSMYYENQLHVAYADRFEILSFNQDYFVDQGSKTIGATVRSRLAA